MVPTPCGEGSEVTCASTPLERLNISFSPSVSGSVVIIAQMYHLTKNYLQICIFFVKVVVFL